MTEEKFITFCLTRTNVDDRNLKVWKVPAKELYRKAPTNRDYISLKLFDDGIQLKMELRPT